MTNGALVYCCAGLGVAFSVDWGISVAGNVAIGGAVLVLEVYLVEESRTSELQSPPHRCKELPSEFQLLVDSLVLQKALAQDMMAAMEYRENSSGLGTPLSAPTKLLQLLLGFPERQEAQLSARFVLVLLTDLMSQLLGLPQ
ncbi:hypothetical protein PC120_g10026 [Phytophthora cactorum]|nr:hypothetical protein PC120_g10026 [Phytophthora cactorum]